MATREANSCSYLNFANNLKSPVVVLEDLNAIILLLL